MKSEKDCPQKETGVETIWHMIRKEPFSVACHEFVLCGPRCHPMKSEKHLHIVPNGLVVGILHRLKQEVEKRRVGRVEDILKALSQLTLGHRLTPEDVSVGAKKDHSCGLMDGVAILFGEEVREVGHVLRARDLHGLSVSRKKLDVEFDVRGRTRGSARLGSFGVLLLLKQELGVVRIGTLEKKLIFAYLRLLIIGRLFLPNVLNVTSLLTRMDTVQCEESLGGGEKVKARL